MAEFVTGTQSPMFQWVVGNLREITGGRGDIIPRIMQLTSDPNTESTEISRMIAGDPILTAIILRMANSSFYGRSRSVVSLDEAIMVLGMSMLHSIVVASAMSSMFRRDGRQGLEETLWNHSLACAIGARAVANETASPYLDEVYICGLMQNLASLILLQNHGKQYRPILLAVKMEGVDLCTMEEKRLGFTNPELGAVLLDMWNFPARLVEAIRFRCNPDAKEILIDNQQMGDVVCRLAHTMCFASALSDCLGYGLRGSNCDIQLEELPSTQFLGLTPPQIANISELTVKRYEEEQAVFKL